MKGAGRANVRMTNGHWAAEIKTERTGFEPADQFYPVASLAKTCFRPLSHLSRVCDCCDFTDF